MENDKSEFGMRRTESPIERFIGKYVVIHVPGNNYVPAGLFNSVIDGAFILNPHQGVDYSTGKPVYRMIETDEIGDINRTMIEEITLESILGYCDYNNRQVEKSQTFIRKPSSLKLFLKKFLPK
jgi:hypothetical protein